MRPFVIGWCLSVSWLVLPIVGLVVRQAFSTSLDLGD